MKRERSLSPVLGVVVFLWIAAATVSAATRTVTNLDDSGPGSLRDTIATANSGDTIVFGVTGAIVFGSEIQFGKNLTISGPGTDQMILQASGSVAMRLFHITSGTITISDLTITKGSRNGSGGAIYKDGGNLTLNGCAVKDSFAPAPSEAPERWARSRSSLTAALLPVGSTTAPVS